MGIILFSQIRNQHINNKIEYERLKLGAVLFDDEEVNRLVKLVDSSINVFSKVEELEYLTIIREILINGIDSKLINSIDDINNLSKIIKI